MSATMVPKPTRITICDICGAEISDYRKSNDPDAYGSIMGANGKKATTETKVMRMRWPSSEWFRKADYGERSKPANRQREYDFHGECLLNLVEAAIDLRKQRESEAHHDEQREQRPIRASEG